MPSRKNRSSGGGSRRQNSDKASSSNSSGSAHPTLPARPPSGPRNSDRGNDRDRRNSHKNSSKGDNRQDSFRPPQSDFTFSMPAPGGGHKSFHDRASEFEASNAPPRHRNRDGPRNGGRDNWRPRGRGSFAGGRGGRPGWQRFNALERPMLTLDSSAPPISLRDSKDGVRYKTLDEISDDSELEMEMSDSDSDPGAEQSASKKKKEDPDANADAASDNPEEPAAKRTRPNEPPSDASTEANKNRVDSANMNSAEAKDAPPLPRWSNPNPYTAIPQPDNNHAKPKDLVKLIRKGRIEEDKSAQANELDELIFFEDSDAENNNTQAVPSSPGDGTWTNVSAPTTPTNDLGSRKRTANDVIKPAPRSKARDARGMAILNSLYGEWALAPGQKLFTPWLKPAESDLDITERLSQEVRDFHSYIEPRQSEEAVRQDLIDRLKAGIKRNYALADCEVCCFGSFMSGLYLPTSDMDLVLVSRRHFQGGPAQSRSKSFMYKFRAFLVNNQLSMPDSIQMILSAKVPIVKYVDRQTNLRVDVSFENLSGVDAIATFKQWRDQFPIMPKLVTLIKNFIAIRALNEPVNGGIGGFSVCCLVVSMLQLDPVIQNLNMATDEHIGELLMEFFNLYGNNFDYTKVAIQLNPPAYVPKTHVQSLVYKSTDRLSVIDPNNVSNDISGGSSRFSEIASCFAAAYLTMQERLEAAEKKTKNIKSLLEPILGGNYAHFDDQRQILEETYRNMTTRAMRNNGSSNGYSNGSRSGSSLPARPHPPPPPHKPPPPPPSQSQSRSWQGGRRGERKGDRRRDRR
ncbi:Poly(A) RNA polymerase protein 1 [Ceratocystis lukuohia]|uniref:polynucleotide adenylyltransferase n=1 Tax=Ceratocystis lukuohia TaxID=2019550 RepID=A0ABR4MP99_9PEZI